MPTVVLFTTPIFLSVSIIVQRRKLDLIVLLIEISQNQHVSEEACFKLCV